MVLNTSGSEGHGISEGNVWREQEKADALATEVRARILDKTGCHVSVGMGGNILLAKVALRRAKPAGQYQIKPEEVLDFLGELKVEDLPGVAYSIGGKLEEMGIKLVKDIRDTSKERLVSVLGPKTGERLWDYSRGIDRVEVGDQPVRKSVSAEVNWGIRFLNQEEAENFVMDLCKELERRLLNEGVKGKHLSVKIMRRSLDAPLDPAKHLGHGKCDTFNKSTVFGVATHSAQTIGKEAVTILRQFKFSPGDLRGLGVQLQRLEPLKPSGAPDGSQRRLDFGAFGANAAGSPSRKASAPQSKGEDDISDFGSPEQSSKTNHKATREVTEDPIAEEPITPQKPKHRSIHPALALARANEADDLAQTPLNMMGTQFIMPSHPDAAVMAELPQDIRSRLMAQQSWRKSSAPVTREASLAIQAEASRPPSRAQSPAVVDGEIPPDIDPEVFNALPDDMKAEILASYRPQHNPPPQSPHKDRTMLRPQPKKSPSKRGRGGIRGMLSRNREIQRDAKAGRVQTNFMTSVNRRAAAVDNATAGDEIEELDAAFLSELPEEVRREVIEDHRRRKLAQKAGLGLNLQAPGRRAAANRPREAAASAGQTTIAFPKAPSKVAFTATSFTSVQEVKDMLNAWHRETEDEGPHGADVEVFEKYLARVVGEERDMEKARKLVRWLDWIIEEDELEDGHKGREGWREALAGVKRAVQSALEARGLGSMVF